MQEILDSSVQETFFDPLTTPLSKIMRIGYDRKCYVLLHCSGEVYLYNAEAASVIFFYDLLCDKRSMRLRLLSVLSDR